jgi:hypothetical protein
MSALSTQQIGKCGELLVQLELLKRGIESAPMTTDAGIDLVAFSGRLRKAVTIQVKCNQRPKPGGGRGRLALDWWIPDDSPADLVAFVDLASSRIWLMTMKELAKEAQQHSAGRYHLYMYVHPDAIPRKDRPAHDFEFERFLFEQRINKLF